MLLGTCLFACLALQDPAAPSHIGPAGFQRAFEEALEEGNAGRMEQLVRENPTEFVPLFRTYARILIDLDGEAVERRRATLARARAIAEATESVFDAPG